MTYHVIINFLIFVIFKNNKILFFNKGIKNAKIGNYKNYKKLINFEFYQITKNIKFISHHY